MADVETIRAEGMANIDALITLALERAASCDANAKDAKTAVEAVAWRQARDAHKNVAEVYSMLGRWIFPGVKA